MQKSQTIAAASENAACVDPRRLLELFAERDALAARVAAVQRQIDDAMREWQRANGIYGIRPEQFRREVELAATRLGIRR